MLVRGLLQDVQFMGKNKGIPTIFVVTGSKATPILSEETPKQMTVREIMKEMQDIKQYYPKYISIISGGDILMEEDLKIFLSVLVMEGYKVELFTDGNLDLHKVLNPILYNPNITIAFRLNINDVDLDKKIMNLNYLSEKDYILVECNSQDEFIALKDLLDEFKLKGNIVIETEKENYKWLSEAVILNRMNCILQY